MPCGKYHKRGRFLLVEVCPYSLKEYLTANEVDFSSPNSITTTGRAEFLRNCNNYFHFGGFPEGALLASKRDYLTSVYQKIFLGDIAARFAGRKKCVNVQLEVSSIRKVIKN
ncbi:MAG: hypothetical protein LBU90_02045 [Bacteroidales bacterium]|jgi:predicted AAA+ superfamily ATPase|nr:hypothetical protein [Bacteroidales bacterium]